jgi:hypothetical protein
VRGRNRIPVLRGAAHRARRRTVLRARMRRVEVAARENRRLDAALKAHLDELERDLAAVIEARLGSAATEDQP